MRRDDNERRTTHRVALIAVATLGAATVLAGAPVGALPGVAAMQARHSRPIQRPDNLPPVVTVGSGPTAAAFDASTHTLYVSNGNDDTVSVVNTATCHARHPRGCGQTVHSIALPAGSAAQWIALDRATKTAYVADTGGAGVSVIDIATCNATDASGCGQTPALVADPAGPFELDVNQATDTVYAANFGAGFSGNGDTLSVIDGARCNGQDTTGCSQVPHTVKVGVGPDAVAVDQATDTVYVANDNNDGSGNTVSVVDGAVCNAGVTSGCTQTPKTLTVGNGPEGIIVDQATHTAYTANNSDSTVSVINTATCNASVTSGCSQRTRAYGDGTSPISIALNAATHTAYVTNNADDTVSLVNTATCNATHRSSCRSLPSTAQVGAEPVGLAVDPGDRTVYVTNAEVNTVSVVNAGGCDTAVTTACRHVAPSFRTAPVEGGTGGIAVNRATHTVYVANQFVDTISVINTKTCNVGRHGAGCRPVATIHDKGGPSDIAVDHVNGTVFVANFSSNTVGVINAATCNATLTTSCGHAMRRVHVGAGPNTLDIDSATGTVYTANLSDNTVSVVNVNTCNAHRNSGCRQTSPTIATGAAPIWLRVNPVTDTAYVALVGGAANTVQVIDGKTCNARTHAGCDQTPASIRVGATAQSVAIDPHTNRIYVLSNVDGGPSEISVIKGTACDSTRTSGCGQAPVVIPGIGQFPLSITLDTSTHTVYAANFNDSSLSVVNVAHPSSPQPATQPRVAVGPTPYLAAVDHANHTIYVTSLRGGTVSLVPEKPAR